MVIQSIKMAMKSILGHKMRTLLTMLGIIIGVLSLVVLVSLVSSATSSVTDEISGMGTDLFTVSVSDDKGKALKQKDMDEISENKNIDLVSPIASVNGTAKNDRESYSVTAEGTDNSYFSIQGLELGQGRLIKQPDLDSASYVVVLSYETADEIYGTANVIGKTLSINGYKFEIVGVLEENDSMTSGMMGGNTVYIPFTVAQRMSDSGTDINTFYATATDSESMDAVETYLDDFMLSRFDNDEDAYTLMNQNTLSETMDSITNTFSILLGGIAAISLLVGGIGIMNIMLVSVTERTKEIGIRKAIGAKSGSIMLQFLTEALVICLLGCAIGILLSAGIIAIVSVFVESISFGLSGTVLLVAIIFSTAIGLTFGVYPARKAAKMNPIDALRYE